jgi:hypothetical protein
MKKSLLRISLIALTFLIPVLISSVLADPPGPPGPGGDPGTGGGVPVGGGPVGGPVGDGICILLSLAIAYGSYKVYEIWKMRSAGGNEKVL